jgi:hypothetical protein
LKPLGYQKMCPSCGATFKKSLRRVLNFTIAGVIPSPRIVAPLA